MKNEFDVMMAYREFFAKHGFPSGRMISGSKSGYVGKYPDHQVIFNACIATQKSGPVWNGDLDLTLDATKLACVAKEICEDLYILSEQDGWRDLTPASITECAKRVILCDN